MLHPRPHGVAQKHGSRPFIDSATILCAVVSPGCSFAGIVFQSCALVSTARWIGTTGIPSFLPNFCDTNSAARPFGGGCNVSGGELGVFSSPSLLPYTPISNSTFV